MIKVNKNNGDISYTKDDTFRMTVYQKREGIFESGAQLRFVMAQTEESEYIIDKTFNINDDMTFTVTLSDSDKKLLDIGEYIYKMIIIKDNKIVTRKNGYFIVKWGA